MYEEVFIYLYFSKMLLVQWRGDSEVGQVRFRCTFEWNELYTEFC